MVMMVSYDHNNDGGGGGCDGGDDGHDDDDDHDNDDDVNEQKLQGGLHRKPLLYTLMSMVLMSTQT